MRPRMDGSTLMYTLRTSSWPSAGSGSACSSSRKLSGVGRPDGREARVTIRVVVGIGWVATGTSSRPSPTLPAAPPARKD